jgi:hypothetical protein
MKLDASAGNKLMSDIGLVSDINPAVTTAQAVVELFSDTPSAETDLKFDEV